MLMKGYCFIDDYIISSYFCFIKKAYGNLEQIMK